jgi:methylated-DNA-protein-cysteine methyltransferase related protein
MDERSDQTGKSTETFAERVFAIVAEIPRGRVTTYGRIAAALGTPRNARMVGWAVHDGPEGLPFHRVVNRIGFLSAGWAFGHPDRMRALLEAEGVPFIEEHRVDLAKCVWEPGSETVFLSASPDEMDDLDAIIGFKDTD